MTDEQALKNLKMICDAALKAGLLPNTESAAALHEMYLHIQKRLSEPNTNNHKQLQSSFYDKTPGRGPEEVGISEPTSY